MLTVPEAARRAGKNPETIRRWIREGKLPARKVGTQHVLKEADLAAILGSSTNTVELPLEWRQDRTGWDAGSCTRSSQRVSVQISLLDGHWWRGSSGLR